MANRKVAREKVKAKTSNKTSKKPKSLAKQQRGMEVTPPSRLGQGYSLLSGEGLNTAITGESDTASGEVTLKCRICDSTESFLGVLDVSVSAAAGFSRIASVDAKLNLMYSLELTSHSVSIVVHSKHVTGTKSFFDTTLKGAPPTTSGALRDFVADYGDTYVSEITEGGEYIAVYAFYSETKDQQLSVMADLKASGIIDGVPVSGSLQTKISAAMKSSNTRINFEQRVLGVKKATLPAPDGIVDYALRFGGLDKDAPVKLAIKARGYEHVPGMHQYFEPVRVNRGIMLQLVETSGKVQRLINQIDGIQSIYDYYGGFADKKLNDVRAQAERDLTTIQKRIDRYLANPVEDCSDAARLSLPSLASGLPTIACDLVSHTVGASGGQGPGKGDVNPSTAVEQRLGMDRIELFAGDKAVHKMKLTYESEDVGKATVEVGGDGGKSKTYVFGKDDYIMNISGVYGSVINNLRITTSKSYIHVARDGAGQPFVWSVPSGFFTVALQGKGDSKGLHSLTVTAAKLKAAIWVPSA